jgi:hypothetical protein
MNEDVIESRKGVANTGMFTNDAVKNEHRIAGRWGAEEAERMA